jgi:hypothetical protein
MADWKSRHHLLDHFDLHGWQIAADSLEAFDASAQTALDTGTYFEYEDPTTGEWRTGCYDRVRGRLTVLDADDSIVSHFPCPEGYIEGYIRRLPHNNYDG